MNAETSGALSGAASQRLLTPQNSALILIDHQPQMAFATKSIDGQTLVNNVMGLAKSAKVFNGPTVLTTVAAKSFSGPIFPTVQALFPNINPIDRTTMNSWEDKNFVDAVKKTGKKKLVMAALWTEVCLATAALSALVAGYEVYIVTDASGGVATEAHEMAGKRMVQAGAVPVTWLQVLLEWQRDWAQQETCDAVLTVAKEHGGPTDRVLAMRKACWENTQKKEYPNESMLGTLFLIMYLLEAYYTIRNNVHKGVPKSDRASMSWSSSNHRWKTPAISAFTSAP